jgi:hypothetical protein
VKFEVTDEESARIDEWLKTEVYPAVIAKQRETFIDPGVFITSCWDDGYPYEGASGGGLTYSFTPTSIGVVTNVRYGEHTLDVTDYGMW